MDQRTRCEIILQNYLKTKEYNTDYKITISNYFIIKYKNIILFYLSNINDYIKHNMDNIVIKIYNHNKYFYYFNNKHNKIIYYKKPQIKIICNNKEEKYYNKFYKMYKKIININKKIGNFKYYSIKPLYIYIYKRRIHYYNKIKLYSNHYSIMFVLYIIFVLYNYIIDYYILYIYIYIL